MNETRGTNEKVKQAGFVWHDILWHLSFPITGPSAFPFRNASEARRFCHEHECPANWNSANEMNCCVYHANIHSCPLGLMVGSCKRDNQHMGSTFI